MKNKIGTKDKPLTLKTPPLSSEYTMHVDEKDGKEILVCTVGKTILHYDMRCLNDLHQMLVVVVGCIYHHLWKRSVLQK